MDLGRLPNMPLAGSAPSQRRQLPLAGSRALGQTQGIEITSQCGQVTGSTARRTEG